MKRILLIILMITLNLTPAIASAQQASSSISIDGKLVEFTSSTGYPFLDGNSRTLVPFRMTLEAFGAKVDWEQSTRTAIAEKDGITVRIPIGEKYIYKNGLEITNDTIAMIKDGKTYLPIRVVIEALGGTVTWDGNERIVVIKSKSKVRELAVGRIIKIEKNSSAGFHWPYYLYIPASLDVNKANYIFVEPNNQPVKQVPFSQTEESAYGTALKNIMYSEQLGMPSIVPVLPGADDMNQITPAYYHAINEEALLIEKEEYKRVDLQLLAMVEDAKAKLTKDGAMIKDQIIINGFSDSGNFANRFTGLHPEKVKVMIAGGINVFLFPIEQYNGVKFNYPLGINDYSKYTGKEFNKNAYDEVAKFIYRGTADEKDPVYGVNFMSSNLKNFIFENLAQDISKRLEISKNIYDANTKNLQFVLYEGIDHVVTNEIAADIVKFISANLGDNYSDIQPHSHAMNKEFYSIVKKAYYLGDREISEYALGKFAVAGPATSPINANTETLTGADLIVCAIVGTEPVSNEVLTIFDDLLISNKSEYSSVKRKNGKIYILIMAESNAAALKLLDEIQIEELMKL